MKEHLTKRKRDFTPKRVRVKYGVYAGREGVTGWLPYFTVEAGRTGDNLVQVTFDDGHFNQFAEYQLEEVKT